MKFPIFLACMAAGCMLAAADFRGSELFDRNRIVPEGMGVNIHFFDHESGRGRSGLSPSAPMKPCRRAGGPA